MILNFSIFAQISGNKIVPSALYPDIKAVADSLNQYGVGNSGIVFTFTDNTVFPVSAPVTILATGNEFKQIIFQRSGTGNKPVLTFSATSSTDEACIKFMSSDYFTIDGLEITDNTESIEYGINFVSNGTDGCNNNIIKNCNVKLNKLNVNQTIGISLSSAPTTISGSNSYNKFFNNTVENCYIGYNLYNTTTDPNFFDSGNLVGTFDGGISLINDLALCGIYIYGQKNTMAFDNIITNIVRIGSGTTAPAGISTSSANPSATMTETIEIYDNVIDNVTSSFTSVFGIYASGRKITHNIYRNSISGIYATGTGSYGATGLNILATSTTFNIYNNYIFDIKSENGSTGASTPATRGFYFGTSSNINAYFNTIVLDFTAINLENQSSAVYVASSTPIIDFRNNIFVNKTILPDGSTGRAVALYNSTNTMTSYFASTNNNLYYSGTPSTKNLIFYGYNSSSPISCITLDDYKVYASIYDQNSISENPTFISADNLHINPNVTNTLNGAGISVTSPFAITEDFDREIRNTTNPDIGADEFNPVFPSPTISGQNSICDDGTVTSWFYTTETDKDNYIWSISSGGTIIDGSNTNQVEVDWNSSGLQWVSVSYTSGGFPQSQPYSYDVNIYQPAEISIQPSSFTVNQNTAVEFSVVANGDINSYQWRKDEQNLVDEGTISGVNSPTLTISSVSPNDAGNYDCKIESYCNTVFTDIATLQINLSSSTINSKGISIYPNPTAGRFMINSENITNLKLLDLTGKIILENNVLQPITEIDITNQPAGIYLLKLSSNDKNFVTKIIKK